MPVWFDSHIHLDALPEPAAAVAEASRLGVAGFVAPAVAPDGWMDLLATVRACPGSRAALGVHPLAAAQWLPEHDPALLSLAAAAEVVAIGEVGLDRQAAADAATQERVLRSMVRLARRLDLPLLLHCRRATGRLLELLREEEAGAVGGIWHAFNGSLETARQAIDLGFALGLGGVLTFPEARRLAEVVQQVPADWLVLETDAPDLAPHPHRGESNRPAWLPLIGARLAELRGWTPAETAALTTANARRVLRLPQECKELPPRPGDLKTL